MLIGEIKSARILRSRALLIVFRNSTQQGKAIRLNKIEGKRVLGTLRIKRLFKELFRGVSTVMSVDQIKDNVVAA